MRRRSRGATCFADPPSCASIRPDIRHANINEGLFANLPNSYAMMSKTAVHHYTGTNVSYPP